MRSSPRGLKGCERVLALKLGRCGSRETLFETLHLVASGGLLLSNSIRNRTCVLIAFRGDDGVERTLIIRSNGIRGLRADYYAGRGWLRSVLLRGRAPGAALVRGDALPTCAEPAPSPQGRRKCLRLEIPCDWRAAYFIAFVNILMDSGDTGWWGLSG